MTAANESQARSRSIMCRQHHAHALVYLLLAGLGALPAAADGEGAPCRPPLLLDRLGTEDGLSHNAVFAVTQDRHGFLWIGTQGGLDRWDGHRFVRSPVAHGGAEAPPSPLVTGLLEDRLGRLWVGTAAGLYHLGPDRGALESFPLPVEPQRIRRLAEGADGGLWVATPTAVVHVGPDARATVLLAEDGPEVVLDLIAGRDGSAWVLRGRTRAEPPDEVRGREPATLVHLGPEGIRGTIELDGSPEALAGAAGGGLWLDPLAPPVRGTESAVDLTGSFSPPPTALLQDSRQRLWIGTLGGLYVREPGGAPCRVGAAEAAPHRLYDEVTTLFEDRAGAIWIGTYGGLLRHDPMRKPFRHLPATEPGGVLAAFVDGGTEGEPVSAVAVEDSGALWAGTFNNGLLLLDSETGMTTERFLVGDGPCNAWIWDLEWGAPGELWVATHSALCRLEAASGAVRGVVPSSVRDVDGGPGGRMWTASPAGLAVVDPATGRIRTLAGEDEGVGVLDTVHVDADGTAWGGAGLESGGTLVRHRPGEAPLVLPAFVPEGIWDVHRSRAGRLWLATGAGLRWIDEAGGDLRLRSPAGAPAAVLYSLQEDGAGRLWAGTSRGLLRFDPKGEVRTRLFDLDDGSGSLEFNRHAVASADGQLYFGGMRGVTRFDPAAIVDNTLVPPVAFTSVRLLGEEGERHRDPLTTGSVELAPSDTTLEVEFVSLDFTQPKKNRYRYRMEGYDEDWVEAGTRGFARYTGLPPGRYELRVLGSNADGAWNEVGAVLPVIVRPAYWQTGWFRGLLALAVAGALIAWHRHRVARLLEMERLRVRIASDLHDDLSSDLSGVALAADSVAAQPELSTESRRRLRQVRERALHLVGGVREIVWAIDPEHDTMEATVRRMRRAAAELLEGSEWSFEVDPAARRGGIAMARRRDLLLVLKEALHNVARHAAAERVTVRLGAAGRWLTLVVTDDGAGFDPEHEPPGYGLKSIRRRAAAMGGEVRVSSAPGRGTRLTLRLPRTRDGGAAAWLLGSGHR